MENGHIIIDIPKRFTDELVQERQKMIVSLACSIWASCSRTQSKGPAVTDTISLKVNNFEYSFISEREFTYALRNGLDR
jgi:hypothetical protein